VNADLRTGSKAQIWRSADRFRFSPTNGHRQTSPTGPFRARNGLVLRSSYLLYSITSSERASRVIGM